MDKKDPKTKTTKVDEVAKSVETNTSKKKGKKALIAVIACVAVALVGCLCFFGYRMLCGKNPVKATTNTIRGLKDSIADFKDESDGLSDLITGDDPFEIDTDIKLNLPKDLGIPNLSLKALVQADIKAEEAKVDSTIKADAQTLMDINSYFANNKFYFRFADSMSNFYFTDISEALEQFKAELSSANIPQKALKYDYAKLIDYLADAFDSAFNNKDFDKSKEKITVNEKEISTTKYTTKITPKKAEKVIDSFLKSVLKDDDLVDVIAELSEKSKSEVKKMIQEAIDEELSKDADDNEAIEYSIYTTSLGKTVAYEFAMGDYSLLITNKDDIITFSTKIEGMNISLSIEKEDDDHYIIKLDAAVVTATIDVKSSLDTIKKNKEYKETLDIDISINAMGQKYNGSLSAVTNIKKISSVDAIDVKSAINIDEMTDAEASKFASEVQKSSTYKTIESLSKSFGQRPLVTSNAQEVRY